MLLGFMIIKDTEYPQEAYCIADGLLEYDEGMHRTTIVAVICVILTTPALFADFSYDHTSRMTGGFLARLPAIAGGNKMREPQRSSVVLKGNRLANIYADHASIIDLDKETITEIRYKEKTYSVMTFAEMKEMMESLQARQKDAKTPDVEFDIDIKNTGQTKVVGGFNASETVMTFKMKSTDPRSGKEATMVMVNDMWLVKDIPGYKEIGNFYKRMAEKANWLPQGGAGGAAAGPGAGMGQAMQAAMKNAQKMDGIPVLHITRMRPEGAEIDSAMAQGSDAQRQQAAAQPQQTPQQTGQNAAEQSAASAIAGRLGRAGGLAGGLGGLRRKKTEQQDAPATPAAPQATAPGAAGDTSLMEMTMESSGFSNAPVDGAKLEVPAGFKLVQKKIGR